MPAGISASDFYYILPELVITAGALLVLVADVLLNPRAGAAMGTPGLPRPQRRALGWLTLAVIAATLY